MKTNFIFLILTIFIISSLFEAKAQNINLDDIPSKDENQEANRVLPPDSATTTTSTTPKSAAKSVKKLKASDNIEPPPGCSYVQLKITCSNQNTTPDLRKFTNATEIFINNGLIENLNLNQIPFNNLFRLDLSKNKIKTFENATSKKASTNFQKLLFFNLRENHIENLGGFLSWNFTNLKELDLSSNPIEELGASSFNKTTQLQTLKLAATNLKAIHETTFWPLTQLDTLDLSGANINNHYSNKQFLKNQQLRSLNLSNNGLIEVPAAIRATASIRDLTLSGNKMTSLRQSDFINQTSIKYLRVEYCQRLTKIDEFTFGEMFELDQLFIRNNQKLSYISRDAFKSETDSNSEVKMLSQLDLSNNNFITMSNPKEFTSLKFNNILLNSNPWHCSCELRWFEILPINERDPVHCKSPQEYKDLELSQYLKTVDCEAEQSGYHKFIVACFLVFLFGLAIAIFAQKSEFLRRLLWKDQYGTIYYTKASFPPETA